MSGHEDLHGASVWFAGTYFMVRDGEIEASPVSGSRRVTYTPARFRERLALLGRLPDKAESASEPDEAEVGELAAVLHHTHCTADDCGWSPTIGDRDNARTALQWMREREAQP